MLARVGSKSGAYMCMCVCVFPKMPGELFIALDTKCEAIVRLTTLNDALIPHI